MLVDIVQTYDEHTFDSRDRRTARGRTAGAARGMPGSAGTSEDEGHTMSTMAMAPALPRTTGRATARNSAAARPTVAPRPSAPVTRAAVPAREEVVATAP